MDIDVVDAEKAKAVETVKKPVKQVAVKKEIVDEESLSHHLSTQSLVRATIKIQILVLSWPVLLLLSFQ